jgi:putative hydrolase of the HAD superfamily
MAYRAVIFDLGGVVFPSPVDALRAYETDTGLPHRFLSERMLDEAGAWVRLERGELDLDEFVSAFESECAAAGRAVDAAEIMRRISGGLGPRPEMLTAIERLRATGLLVAALTNNWLDDDGRFPSRVAATFDVVVESSVVGMRKPDPRIYEIVCARLDVPAEHCVFLDDFGVNLKPARALGMYTIKVSDPSEALGELQAVLGVALTS